MLSGTAAPDALAAAAPEMPALDTETVALEDVELLQVLCEISSEPVPALLPPALHPTVPGVVSWLVLQCKESPWGAFRMAQTRIECRSGTRPRGLLISGVIDNEDAREALAARWGFRLTPGQIDWRRGYDGVDTRVTLEKGEDEPILEIGLREPTLLPPEVVQFVSSVHPATTEKGYRLVQVDPAYEMTRAERGEPVVESFDAAAWGEPRIEPTYPISAAVCLGKVTLPRIRFLGRPGEIAFSGTERLEAPV